MERHVGAILDALASRGWRVVHDMETDRGNIDHVVVGLGGVFIVETKGRARLSPADAERLTGALLSR
jgi:hypothetical protein